MKPKCFTGGGDNYSSRKIHSVLQLLVWYFVYTIDMIHTWPANSMAAGCPDYKIRSTI